MFMTNNESIQEVLFFPQMRPERRVAADVQLNEEEKSVLAILQKSERILLTELKDQSGLSNKKWDKAIKGLTKHGIAKVSKTDDGLFVEVI